MAKARLLITRFAPHAERLANLLNEQGVFSLAQPLLKIEPVVHFNNPFIKHYDLIIAISANAVECTSQSLCNKEWPVAHYFAVGETTKALLEIKTKQAVQVPVDSFNSEGLLALPQLQQLKGRACLILRGVKGREFLKQELISRGASVDYFESYQRVAIKLSRSTGVDKWQQQGINGAIISSIELLDQLVLLANSGDLTWLKSLTLFSASERILQYAQTLGFIKMALLPSIADQDIIDYFTDEGSYDRY